MCSSMTQTNAQLQAGCIFAPILSKQGHIEDPKLPTLNDADATFVTC